MPRPKKVDANSNAPAKINNSQKKTTSSTQVVRAYELAVGDVVEISADGFSGDIAVKDGVELKAISGVTAAMQLTKKA